MIVPPFLGDVASGGYHDPGLIAAHGQGQFPLDHHPGRFQRLVTGSLYRTLSGEGFPFIQILNHQWLS